MKRKIILLVLIIIMVFSVGSIVRADAIKNVNSKRVGVSIDCARVYYAPSTIKHYIDTIAQNHGNYLQLHLSDNERFGIESDTLHQTPDTAVYKNGTYYNPKTKKAFWTKQQLQSIIDYGQTHNVQVVPEIDVPGHSKAILTLLSYIKNDKNLLKQVKAGSDEVDYHKTATINLIKKIYGEYVHMLPAGWYFATGGDEFSIGGSSDEKALVKFDNALDDYLNQNGLKMQVWNDSIHKKTLQQYHKDILVNFWSLSGETDDPDDYSYNISKRATLPEINKAGIKTINSNEYYTYIIADSDTFAKADVKEWKKELSAWKPNMWNDDTTKDVTNSSNNIGTSLSIWNDGENSMTGYKTYVNSAPLITYFFQYLNKLKYLN